MLPQFWSPSVRYSVDEKELCIWLVLPLPRAKGPTSTHVSSPLLEATDFTVGVGVAKMVRYGEEHCSQ